MNSFGVFRKYLVGKFPLNKLFKLNTADFSAAMVLMLEIEVHMATVIFLFAANLIGKLGQQKAGQTDKRHVIFQQHRQNPPPRGIGERRKDLVQALLVVGHRGIDRLDTQLCG